MTVLVRRPQRVLGEGLLWTANSEPDKVAVIVEGTSYSYGQLLDSALRLASALQSRGVRKGDRVAIFMENNWPCVVSIYGVLLAGAVIVVVNSQTKSNKLHFILENSEARVLLADGRLASVFVPVINTLSVVEQVLHSGPLKLTPDNEDIFTDFDTVLAENQPTSSFGRVIPNDLAALIYTSGTTGNPKGVMQTHQAMVFAAWSVMEYLRLSISDRILLVLPLSFGYGLYQLLMTIKLGATLVVERSFAFPGQVFKRIEDEQITVFPGVPTIFSTMISAHRKKALVFPSVTRVTNAAAALSVSMIPELKEIFPNALIYKMYGQTECKRISYLEPELIDLKPRSVGKAIPGTEVLLLSPDGMPVQPGALGILHVRGPHVMAGYWRDEELSAQVLKAGTLPGEVVLCTQDWFRMDDEGFLYFQGRSDDIIKTKGEKVSPIEVENVVRAMPGIKDAAVVGVADSTYGQLIKAFIVADEGRTLSDGEIRKWCMARLENCMVPQYIVQLEEIPTNGNGKTDKKQLVKMG